MITLLTELEKHATHLYQKIRVKEYIQQANVRQLFHDFDDIFHQTNDVFPFSKEDPLQLSGIQTFSQLIDLLYGHLFFYRRILESFMLLEPKKLQTAREKINEMIDVMDNMGMKR